MPKTDYQLIQKNMKNYREQKAARNKEIAILKEKAAQCDAKIEALSNKSIFADEAEYKKVRKELEDYKYDREYIDLQINAANANLNMGEEEYKKEIGTINGYINGSYKELLIKRMNEDKEFIDALNKAQCLMSEAANYGSEISQDRGINNFSPYIDNFGLRTKIEAEIDAIERYINIILEGKK